jgi:hypothetical protein
LLLLQTRLLPTNALEERRRNCWWSLLLWLRLRLWSLHDLGL